jgi:hypothetical protein
MSKFARKIRKRGETTGLPLESIADFIAICCIAIAGLVGFAMTLAGLQARNLLPVSGALLVTLLAGFLHWFIFRVIAEVIRLLKKIAGLQHSGHVSGHRELYFLACSNCGMPVNTPTRCDGCGAQFEDDETSS